MIKVLTEGFPYKPDKGCFGYSTSVIVNQHILFDTGGYNIRKLIIENIANIDKIIISHLHFDHCSNLDLFVGTNLPIYISEKELKYYNENRNNDIDLFSYFKLIKNDLNIIEVKDHYQIDDNIKIISTPGHTPGHISLTIKENNDNILIAGDSIKTYNDYNNNDEYGNAIEPTQYIETKKKCKKEYNIIYPGHDCVIKNGIIINKERLRKF